MRNMLKMITAVVLALAGVGTASGQGFGTVEGFVRTGPDNKPVANATVLVVGTRSRATTDSRGHYTVDSVPAGTVSIRATMIGFKPYELDGVRIRAGITYTNIDFPLEAQAVTLTEIRPGASSTAMVLRFQLIRPIGKRTTDKAIMPVDSVLRDLFQWPGYELLSQAAVTVDMPMSPAWGGTGASSHTQTMLNIDGNSYELSVTVDTTAPPRVKMWVTLYSVARSTSTPPPKSAVVFTPNERKSLLSTSVTVKIGHTVVLGSTQPGGGRGGLKGTLILAVKPEMRPAN
jgi:hypothetical protein